MAKGSYPARERTGADLFKDAGDETYPEPQQKPVRGSWKAQDKPRKSRDHTRAVRPQGPPQVNKNQRPDEVSEDVWALAQQWLDMAEAKYGDRPPVNKQNFSKRLSDKINSDENLRYWLRVKPEGWARFGGRWEDGRHFINDVLSKMLDLFFTHLTQDQKIGSIQFAFLDDEWDEWVYQAVTAVQVAWHKANSEWVKYDLPTAVFDRSTVGRPEDDDPCTDPEFAGMTWGEVRALRSEEHLETDDGVESDHVRERMEAAGDTFARLRSVMVANREETTKKERE